MKINDALAICKSHISTDRRLRDNKPPQSDYEKFCESQCEAMEVLIRDVEEHQIMEGKK